jgi:hypothetical protein
MINETDNRWRISLTSNLAKGYWRNLGIPRPTEYTYRTYSQVVPQSQGGTSRQGYINMLLVWERLNRQQLAILESFRSGAGAGLLYLTVDRSNGSSYGFDWVDISCYPGSLEYAAEPGSRGNVYTGTQWKLNNITTINVPASF